MDTGGNGRGLPSQMQRAATGAELPPPPIPSPAAYDVTGAQLPLPPPPPVPYGGLYLDSVQLANTLRFLRAKAQTRADNARLAMILSGVLMLMGSLGFGFYIFLMTVMSATGASAGSGSEEWIVFLFSLPFGLLYLVYGIVVLATVGKVFPYHYALAWYRLLNESDSILLADEERLRILQDSLPGKFWGSAVVKHHFTTLGDRLEFAAFHLPSLRMMARQPEQPPRALMRQTEVARQYAKHFDSQGTVIGCCLAAGLISYAQLLYLVVALRQGPAVCQASARLAAFIDFYLEEPRLDITRIPPPPPERGWWQRTTAPWNYRAG